MILLCISIDNPDSLQNVVDKWKPELNHFCPDIPFILVGNKKDLRDEEEVNVQLERFNQKPVTFEEGEEVARKIGAVCYIECSAKTREGVREVFEAATFASLQKRTNTRNKRKHYCYAKCMSAICV